MPQTSTISDIEVEVCKLLKHPYHQHFIHKNTKLKTFEYNVICSFIINKNLIITCEY